MKYNVNNNNLSQVFFNIQKEIEKSQEIIEQLLKIDYQYSNLKVNLDELTNIFCEFKNEKIDIKKEQKVMIRYNGNPSITLNLILLAILTKTIIILDFDQNMLGINSFILEVANNTLNNFQTDNLIYLSNQTNQEMDKIICIDDIYKYNEYLRKQNTKAKFYSFNYIDFYRDSDEFQDITKLIYQYAEENEIPIESYSEFEPEEAAEMIEIGLGSCAVILTSSQETKETFEKIIKSKKIIINKNPYKQKKKLIDKEIFYI